MKRSLSILSLALLILATACKKDEYTPTVTQKLEAKRWQLRSAIVSAPGQPTIDGYAATLPCTQDDIVIYDPSNVWYYDEGATKCDPRDPQTQTGTWRLSNNDTQVIITFGGATNVYTIDELTDTSLKLNTSDTQNSIVTTVKLGYVPVP